MITPDNPDNRYDYAGQEEDDLVFSAGARITIHARVDDEWMEGETEGDYGIFPINYVEILEDEFVFVPGYAADDSFSASSSTTDLAATAPPSSSAGLKLTGPIQELLVTEQNFAEALKDVSINTK